MVQDAWNKTQEQVLNGEGIFKRESIRDKKAGSGRIVTWDYITPPDKDTGLSINEIKGDTHFSKFNETNVIPKGIKPGDKLPIFKGKNILSYQETANLANSIQSGKDVVIPDALKEVSDRTGIPLSDYTVGGEPRLGLVNLWLKDQGFNVELEVGYHQMAWQQALKVGITEKKLKALSKLNDDDFFKALKYEK